MAEESNQKRAPKPTMRGDDFSEVYSNNVQFEISAFDIKLLFGQLDQGNEQPSVRQRTSVTMSWSQAKLLAFFLTANVLIHEGLEGPIQMPKSAMPPSPPAEVPERLHALYRELFGLPQDKSASQSAPPPEELAKGSH